jgi:hypothetical protein
MSISNPKSSLILSRLVISQPSTLFQNGLPSPAEPPFLKSKTKQVAYTETKQEPFVSTNGQKRCSFCGVQSTPMWRNGPGIFTTLCNSCGVKWRRGKILNSGTNKHHLYKAPLEKNCKLKVEKEISDIETETENKRQKIEHAEAETCFITPENSPQKGLFFINNRELQSSRCW